MQMEKKISKEFNNKGFDLYKQGNYNEAIIEFEKAIEINPFYKEALYNKALALFLLNKYEDSINDINKALLIQDNYTRALNLKGLIFTTINRFYEATVVYDKEIDPSSLDGSYYFNKGLALAILNYSESIENFNKSIDLKFDIEQSRSEIEELEKNIRELNLKDKDNSYEYSKLSTEDQLRLYNIYCVNNIKSKYEKKLTSNETEIASLNEKIQKLEDLFNDKLNILIDNQDNKLNSKQNKTKINLENEFTAELELENFEEISLSPRLIKDNFSSENIFHCKICENLIINITQCGKCENLFCKKCINLKLQENDFCSMCKETFEYGNVPKITNNIINGFKLNCPLNCGNENLFYSNIFQHLKECINKGKIYSCNFCKEKIIISKENEFNLEDYLISHSEKCLEKICECIFCKVTLLRKGLKEHLDICEDRNIHCEKCKFNYSFKMEQPHNEEHCKEISKLRGNLEIFRKKNEL